MLALNATHDPLRRSWVLSANRSDTDFPIQNLPHGVFSCGGAGRRGGVAIGDCIFDIGAWLSLGQVQDDLAEIAEAAARETLNDFIAMGNAAASRLRAAISDFLSNEGNREYGSAVLVPMDEARIHMPLVIGAFTDFMTSLHHVSAPRRSRPARVASENFLYLPVAYNGRASSITEDGVDFYRPLGQRRDQDGTVSYSATAELDYELEFGAIVGKGNTLGQPVAIDAAPDYLFGYVLVNDWSARDIQIWESRLGPFLGKSFRTTISPWLVTAEAIAPFRIAAPIRKADEPAFLPHLQSERHAREGGIAMSFTATLSSAAMRERDLPAVEICRTQLHHCSWSFEQMLTHHTSNGCNLSPGDLLSSGTISGPEEAEAACLFEQTAGILPISLPTGESRVWLEDGDILTIRGRGERQGYQGIGFGECSAMILPAIS